MARLLLLAALLAQSTLWAHSAEKGEIAVRQAWTRATPPGATLAAGYLEIHNAAREPERLVGASTPLAERVELHVTVREGEVVRMREVKSLDIPAGERLVLQPRGSHLMLVNIKRPFAMGERVPLTLRFERSGELKLELAVQALGSTKPQR